MTRLGGWQPSRGAARLARIAFSYCIKLISLLFCHPRGQLLRLLIDMESLCTLQFVGLDQWFGMAPCPVPVISLVPTLDTSLN